MLRGRFGGTTGRPYIEARLFVPRLRITGNISFLVDTGADSSLLMPGDAARLRIPYDQLTGGRSVVGLGGEVRCYIEEAFIVFTDPGVTAHIYVLNMGILPADPSMMDFRSLLGRDVLDCWRLVYDPARSLLRATVRSSDFRLDLRDS